VCLSSAPTHDGFLRQLVALLDGHGLYVPDRPLRADPREAVALLGAGEVDLLDCTPDDLEALLDAGLREAPADRGQGRFEPVVVVGTRAAVSPELWRTLRSLSGVRGHVLYGPPECAFGATARATAGASARAGASRPMANVASHVLDLRGQPVPTRAVGELHLGGPSLARGHLGQPQPTRQRFVERTPEGASGRLLRTGQLARRLPDGGVELLGPVGGDADLGGFRVDPARIQAALAGCPGVRDVAVGLQRDERGKPRLVAHVVPAGEPPTLARLRACLWARLPGYACPSTIAVVPRLPARGVADVVAASFPPDPPPVDERADASAEASVLTALWAEVIGVEQVSPGENYWQTFSFLEVLDRARDAGVSVAGKHVTRNRTVQELAADLAADRHRPKA
ncbi:MAG TPA: AMP-binding protein, partial [Egibacteraceae bacterium]|nr:AMP-binding protein [Egibacteraceae bacterium]